MLQLALGKENRLQAHRLVHTVRQDVDDKRIGTDDLGDFHSEPPGVAASA